MLLFICVLSFEVPHTHVHVLYTLKIFKTCNYTQTSLQTCHAQIACESLFAPCWFLAISCAQNLARNWEILRAKNVYYLQSFVFEIVCSVLKLFTLRVPSCSEP